MKLTDTQVENQAQALADKSKADDGRTLAFVQGVITTMLGGGPLASFAVRQPQDFYVDDRVHSLPFNRRDIANAMRVYARMCELLGTPNPEPSGCQIYSMGIL